MRLCRAYVGSRALPGYGDEMTAHAVDQVEAAVTKRMLESALASGDAEVLTAVEDVEEADPAAT